jgi:hypothetical protein
MAFSTVTPERKLMLEAYIKCLLRAERRILLAHHVVTGARYDRGFLPLRGRRITHVLQSMRVNGFERYAQALMCLRLARSKFTAELTGLQWGVN